ncbi:alpha/beta hydrolase [Kitasatospora kifunensis]|uniref:Alpha-beta hydrolase superfamily lysophospholipase n=1 Tax=Kitasatospora kifunensis TaxID=58351 RepID=A0A7W7R9C1_KITKI|nr:alpha/beta fold hydrolase [Kitasatospora kifunensis]MBB4927709.1 alpha-beta hydrolase superfamily lysophospholipase [Kitasatospora kifunensis]
MLELKRQPQDVRKEIVLLRREGVDLALHVWRPPRPKAAIFYFHGLQSHAGWLWEVGPRYADNDVAFFVLDRRGSGLSGGTRHEITSPETVLGDYGAAIERVRTLIGDELPLGLFGHCLGGSFLAALLHHPDFTTRYDSAVFCSAALGRMHARLTAEQRQAVAEDQRTELWDAGLSAPDFTHAPRYRQFIESDELAVRRITHRSRATLLALEQLYLDPRRELPPVPTAFVSGHSDPVVDLDESRRVFATITGGRGLVLQLPTDRHYLYYTDVCDELVDWSSMFTLLRAVDRSG